LKIHHALKETSYLSDVASMTFSGEMAITIGDYLLVFTGAKLFFRRRILKIIINKFSSDLPVGKSTEVKLNSSQQKNSVKFAPRAPQILTSLLKKF